MNDVIWISLFNPDLELQSECGNCDTDLPKEDWEIRTEDTAAVAEIDCPNCGEYNDVRIE